VLSDVQIWLDPREGSCVHAGEKAAHLTAFQAMASLKNVSRGNQEKLNSLNLKLAQIALQFSQHYQVCLKIV